MPWATTEAWHESHPLSTQSLYDDDIARRQRRRIRMILLKQRRRRRRRERCTPRRRRGGWCAPVANDCPRLQGSVSIFLPQPPWRLAPLIVDLGFRFNLFVQTALEACIVDRGPAVPFHFVATTALEACTVDRGPAVPFQSFCHNRLGCLRR